MDSAPDGTDYPENAINVTITPTPMNSRAALAKLALLNALGSVGKRLLDVGPHYALIIEVHSAQWITQIKKTADVLAHGRAEFVNLADRAKDQPGVDASTSALIAKGGRVIFVACDEKPAPTFLRQLDSAVSSRDGIIVMGATNRIEDLSPALVRPGRLERGIYIGPPTIAGLQNILRTHLGSDLAGSSLVDLAQAADGATAAEVMDWVRAARRRSRQEQRPLALSDIMDQIHPADARPESERMLVTIHEAGHAVVGLMFGHALVSVATTAKGGTGGQTCFDQPLTIHRGKDLEELVVRSLAGRAAEIVILGVASSGAGASHEEYARRPLEA